MQAATIDSPTLDHATSTSAADAVTFANSPQLAAELDRLERVVRQRKEADLARLRELARFD